MPGLGLKVPLGADFLVEAGRMSDAVKMIKGEVRDLEKDAARAAKAGTLSQGQVNVIDRKRSQLEQLQQTQRLEKEARRAENAILSMEGKLKSAMGTAKTTFLSQGGYDLKHFTRDLATGKLGDFLSAASTRLGDWSKRAGSLSMRAGAMSFNMGEYLATKQLEKIKALGIDQVTGDIKIPIHKTHRGYRVNGALYPYLDREGFRDPHALGQAENAGLEAETAILRRAQAIAKGGGLVKRAASIGTVGLAVGARYAGKAIGTAGRVLQGASPYAMAALLAWEGYDAYQDYQKNKWTEKLDAGDMLRSLQRGDITQEQYDQYTKSPDAFSKSMQAGSEITGFKSARVRKGALNIAINSALGQHRKENTPNTFGAIGKMLAEKITGKSDAMLDEAEKKVWLKNLGLDNLDKRVNEELAKRRASGQIPEFGNFTDEEVDQARQAVLGKALEKMSDTERDVFKRELKNTKEDFAKQARDLEDKRRRFPHLFAAQDYEDNYYKMHNQSLIERQFRIRGTFKD